MVGLNYFEFNVDYCLVFYWAEVGMVVFQSIYWIFIQIVFYVMLSLSFSVFPFDSHMLYLVVLIIEKCLSLSKYDIQHYIPCNPVFDHVCGFNLALAFKSDYNFKSSINFPLIKMVQWSSFFSNYCICLRVQNSNIPFSSRHT